MLLDQAMRRQAASARRRAARSRHHPWPRRPERAAFLGGQLGAFQWTRPGCGELVSDRGPLGNHPAADEQARAEGCQRLAAQVAEWLSQGD
jgi:hypothetical protein